MKALLTKVKWSKGVMENGQTYDYTRVYLQMPIYEGSPNEFGVDIMECEYGEESKHSELLGFKGKLPCEVDIEMTQVMKKGKLVNFVTSLRPNSVSVRKPSE